MSEYEDEKMDVISVGIDAVAIGVGGAVGLAVTEVVDSALPVAVTTMDVVKRSAVKYGSGITAQWLTSTAVAEDLHEMRGVATHIHRMVTNKFKKTKKHHKKVRKNENVRKPEEAKVKVAVA